jgi:capsular exopolysaccharide synthesis family protein
MNNDRKRLHDSRSEGSATTPVTAGVWDHLRTFVRHRWWALAGFVLLAAPMAAVTLLTTPVYEATTRLLIGQDTPRIGLERQREETQSAVDSQTQTQVVRSRALARDVVESLKLWEAPEFAPMVATLTDDKARATALVDPLLGRMTVGLVPDSRVVALSVEAEDPALAARIANETATRFIARERESKFQAASATAEWLNERLAEQRAQVEKAEAALQNYRSSNDAMSLLERQNIVGQQMLDLNSAVTKAKTDRLLKETQFQQIQGIRNDPVALEVHPIIAANGFVQTLRAQAAELGRQDAQLAERLGPKHPDRIQIAAALESVQGRLRTEIAKVVAGVETEYQAALAQETSLTGALNTQKAAASTLDRKGVAYNTLEREALSARQVFDSLLQQTKDAMLQSNLDRSSIRVIDPAEPPGAPIRPRRNQGLMAAGLLGLIGAAGGAFGREYLRRKVHSPADIEQRLGLPVLAMVPPAPADEANSAVGMSPLPGEAFRRLRANVMLACGDDEEPGKVLVVTSAAPGEGKSFVSSHLALALAAVDQRVALIDADLRRPRLHTVFDRQRAPGLSDVLLGRRSTAEVLRPVGQQGLVIVPSGLPSTKAAELLSYQSFRTFIDELRSDFDWIIIDSPPVMAVADAAVLSRDATAMLFVTSAEQTSLEAAEAALNELGAVGARLLGAVLNRAPITREAFYYSRYYQAAYEPYLTATENPEPAPQRAPREQVPARTS